ncbi:MAG: CocE/NonD family hydrolase, partial [Bacteroidetes bacterium]|nr:CocE/NonD family hydrolase [Bacteroidota bacterium]
DSKPSPFPTVLLRTPYNKKLLKAYGDYYSSHGYITAIQDVRGKYDSKGDWKPYEFEGRDGYDTIEWLANQEFSDGKIGMVGGSYSGSVQLAAAINAPPHLVTIIPNITPATPFNNTPYENGVFALGWGIRWSNIVYEDITGQEMNERFREVFQKNWYEELENLPVIDLDEMITGEKIDFWRAWINNPPVRNSYYHDQNYLANLHRINIPVFLQSGWFDVANRGTKLIYKNLIDSGNKNVKLIIGPWVHSDKSSKQLGSLYLGEKAGINLFDIYVKWFDYWLKGIDNGITNDPLVQIFNIGPNNWIYDDEYPIASAQETALYLMSGSNNNSSGIQGKLIVENSGSSPGFTTFRYDPSNPTPGISDYLKKNILSEYQYIIEKRDDVIIFETDPLTYPLTIMGSISAELYASSSAIDTDFSVTLTAVNGKGNIFPIGQTFGVIRAKHRNSINKAELLEKLNVYKYTIDLSHTCYTIAPGEKLRLEISSCSFPEFARNLNTGKNNQTTKDFIVAEQKIYHNKEYPSRIVFYTK